MLEGRAAHACALYSDNVGQQVIIIIIIIINIIIIIVFIFHRHHRQKAQLIVKTFKRCWVELDLDLEL